MQAALDAAYWAGGGAIVPTDFSNAYDCTGLIIPPRVSIIGAGTSLSEVYYGQAGSNGEANAIRGPVIRQLAGATTPLLRNDKDGIYTNSYIRNTSNYLNDVSNNPEKQRYGSFKIAGVTLEGQTTLQTAMADLVYLERAWCVELVGCNIMHANGFGVCAIDCNTLNFDYVNSHYSPWFLADTADSQFQRCSISGSDRFGTALWIHTAGSSNLQFTNNLIYNSSVNLESQWSNPTDTASVRIRRSIESIVTGINTEFTCTSHKLYDAYPVLITPAAGATLPTGLYQNRVYWVRRTGGNTVKLAENLNLLRKSVFVQVSDVGSGTIYIDRGPAANIAITGGANRIMMMSGRCDQSYGDGVLLMGSPKNTICLNVNQSGLGSTAARSGIRLVSGYVDQQPTVTSLQASDHNTILGSVDGVTTTYGSWTSNQATGVSVEDAASLRGINILCDSVNHQTANFNPSYIKSTSRQCELTTSTTAVRTAAGTAADLTYTTLRSVTIPAGSMGANGYLEINFDCLAPNATYTRLFRVMVNGTTAVANVVSFANLYYPFRSYRVWADGLTQLRSMMSSSVVNSASAAAPTTVSVSHNTSDITIDIQVAWQATPAAGDTISLRGIDVKAVYSA